MRILAYVNHYFGTGTSFRGKSTTQDQAERRRIVAETCAALRALPGDVDLEVCGVAGAHLVPIRRDFTGLVDPRLLVYASIEEQMNRADAYDYVINIEDDIYLPRPTFEAIVRFDAAAPIDTCLLPNRLEEGEHGSFCVDVKALPGWTDVERSFEGKALRVANNPHSGLSILSREKVRFARERMDLKRRDVIIGGLMASAYANLHAPFKMYRSYEDLQFAHVVHLDPWQALPPAPALHIERRGKPVELAAIVVCRDNPHRVPAIVEAIRTHTDHVLVWNNNPEIAMTIQNVRVINSGVDCGAHAVELAACALPAQRYWIQDDSEVRANIEPVPASTIADRLRVLLDAPARLGVVANKLTNLQNSAGVQVVRRVKSLPGVEAVWAAAKWLRTR